MKRVKEDQILNTARLSITLHKKMKFSIMDFFSKCDQIRRKLRKIGPTTPATLFKK